MKIAIAVATGNIGSRVAAKLSAAGAVAVLIGQNEDRLKKLNIPNSIIAVADLENTNDMISATKENLKGW